MRDGVLRTYRLIDRKVVPCSLKEWGETWYADRPVAHDIVGDARVSTVFLGIDHRFFGDGPPLVFETMIFGGPANESQFRYSSYDEALDGHRTCVDELKAIQKEKTN